MNYRTKIRVLGVGASYYHVMSRITERRFYLGALEKDQFVGMMRRVAVFSGVEVLTYCVLDNHFHMLIQVPERVELSDEELVGRLRYIYREVEVQAFARELAEARGEVEGAVKRVRERYLYRMYDLSEFMKTLKQRFASWYNAVHQRSGHLWDDRFKSVLVQGPEELGRPGALWTMAQYIELNAVRAGVVKEASAYRWCGFGEAEEGGCMARRGIGMVCSGGLDWEEVSGWYGDGLRAVVRSAELERMRGLMQEAEEESIRNCLKGSHIAGAGLWLLGLCRVRYFVDGVVFGAAEFVEEMFETRRHLFCESRKTGARKMRGGDWGGLCTVRDFRKKVIGHVDG